MKPYYNLRNELSIVNNLNLKSSKVVIASTLTEEIKTNPDTSYLGIKRAKLNVKSTMYWLNIDRGINEMINNSRTCQKYQNSNLPEPLISHKIPKDIWNKVASNLFVCLNKLYITDYTSNYFKLAWLSNLSSDAVIIHMRSIFTQHAIPKVV